MSKLVSLSLFSERPELLSQIQAALRTAATQILKNPQSFDPKQVAWAKRANFDPTQSLIPWLASKVLEGELYTNTGVQAAVDASLQPGGPPFAFDDAAVTAVVAQWVVLFAANDI